AKIALHLAKEGASVAVNYSSSKEAADKVVSEIIKNGGKAVAIQANLAKPNEIETLFTETKKAFGKLDILVNNAGVYQFVPIEEVNQEHFNKIFDLNVLGLLLAIKESVKHFGSSGGCIINISSIASTSAPATSAVYSASKASVDAITKVLAKELGPKHIRVISINPGMVETEGTHTGGFLEGDFHKEVEASTPLGRIGQPEDIAPAVVFFASSDASWITGEALNISGGYR
ncbi:MAG: glucose 1-dehydrogenase, partial [Parachlamydiaceae bacterium]|nr:glucose 1-dehydrogenase [Parachlamydiaceae bacterium]